MTSTHSAILSAIKDAIVALDLTDCEEVAVRAEPKDGEHFYHGITVSPVREEEYRGTNERDDIGYGVQITMVVANDVDPTETDLFGTWRQEIRKEFIHQKISTVSSVHTVLWEHGPIYQKIPEHLDVGTFVMRVISREGRA